MIHATQIADEVTYCNRYVKTNRLAQEAQAGEPIFAKVWGATERDACADELALWVGSGYTISYLIGRTQSH